MKNLERRVRRLELILAAFVVLHGFLIPLLPKLFDKSPEITVGALVWGAAMLLFYVLDRRP